MTYRDRILKITSDDKKTRMAKILSLIERPYRLVSSSGAANIVIPAKTQKNRIAVLAHWDVFPGSRGYNDNSSGVVVLLELQHHVPENVELVFTDMEEQRGKGSRLYLSTCLSLPKMAINVDVVGIGNKVFYAPYDNDAIKVGKGAERLDYRIPFSDSYVLEEFGVPNVLLMTGLDSKTLISDVFKAQHNNVNDGNLSLIKESAMGNVFEAVLGIISFNTKSCGKLWG